MRPAAIVLAGGTSSRFGADKLAADLEGRPVLEHALRPAAAVAIPIVLVVGPDDPVPWLPADLGADVVLARDAVAHQGPLAGLAAGLAALPHRGDVAIVVAGDMPTLVPAVLELLAGVLARDPSLGVVCLEAEPASPLPAAVRPSIAGPAAEKPPGGGSPEPPGAHRRRPDRHRARRRLACHRSRRRHAARRGHAG